MWGNQISLEVVTPDDLPTVAVDPEALQRILAHLFDNSRERWPRKGPSRDRPSGGPDGGGRPGTGRQRDRAGPHVELAVVDTGVGLSPEARQRVLAEPFFSTKPRHRGLGLTAVCGVMHAHRGGVRVDPAPGRGTVVRLFLPVAGAGAGGPARHGTFPRGRETANGSGRR